MLKAVLFDFDGVLTVDKTGSQSTLRSLARHTGIPEERLRTAYYRHNRAMLDGKKTHADIWDEFCAEVGQPVDYSLLHTAFVETPLDGEMLSLLRELKGTYRIGMVTDNKVDRIEAILMYHDLHALFDVVTISAEVGSGKVERTIFERTLEALGLKAEECLFIDNTAKNLVVPQMMGMETCLFDDDKRDVEGLRQQIDALAEMVCSHCGMRCDLCHLYRPNVEREDRRAELCTVFGKVWPGYAPDPQATICDGCTCTKPDAVKFSPDCPTRRCVQEHGFVHCGSCPQYPCADFPAEPTHEALVQAIDVEKRWTWEEERLMEAYRCRANMDAWRKEHHL